MDYHDEQKSNELTKNQTIQLRRIEEEINKFTFNSKQRAKGTSTEPDEFEDQAKTLRRIKRILEFDYSKAGVHLEK